MFRNEYFYAICPFRWFTKHTEFEFVEFEPKNQTAPYNYPKTKPLHTQNLGTVACKVEQSMRWVMGVSGFWVV